MHDPAGRSGVYGRAPDEWEQVLRSALDSGEPARVRSTLCALADEIGAQTDRVDRHAAEPVVDRLVEQARRLIRGAPTTEEALQQELGAERQLWAGFRERYRETFVPPPLRPFLGSCCLFVAPAETPPTFEGFDKFHGHASGRCAEAVTLFLDHGATAGGPPDTPPNFFSAFHAATGQFVVLRAYRTSLPRGAGAACILEHLHALIPDPGALKELIFDNVQNTASYRAHVGERGGVASLRGGVGVHDSPLGRLGARLLAELGLQATGVRPALDGFGFLDLVIGIGQ